TWADQANTDAIAPHVDELDVGAVRLEQRPDTIEHGFNAGAFDHGVPQTIVVDKPIGDHANRGIDGGRSPGLSTRGAAEASQEREAARALGKPQIDSGSLGTGACHAFRLPTGGA